MMATQSEKKKILEENLLLQYIFILVETHSSPCISLLALNTIHKNCYIGKCVWQITIIVLYIFNFWELYVASTFIAL